MSCEKKTEEKTIIITGATSGIGLAATMELVKKGAFVIATGRDASRCENAKELIKASSPAADPVFLTGDLSSITQVMELARNIKKAVEHKGKRGIDVLINNAGTVSSWYKGTEDGFELQFAVNHLAPFLLTYHLLPLIPDGGRIVTVSSGSHYRTKINWKDVFMRKNYNCLVAYKQSKLANVLFTAELNRRLSLNGIGNTRAYAVDPGLVNTDIGLKGTSGFVKWVWKMRSKRGTTPYTAAKSIAYLAYEPSIQNYTDLYWKDCRPKKPSRYSLREDMAARLWELSERMCSIKFL